MKILLLLIACTFLLSTNNDNAQEITKNDKVQEITKNDNEIEKNSFSGNLLGSSSLIGISYERLLSEKFVFEIGVGIVGIGTGITFYPFKIKLDEICPYTGIKISSVGLVDVGGGYGGYIPFGLTFFSKHRINVGIDIGPALGEWVDAGGHHMIYDPNIDYSNTHPIYVYGNLKIGIRF